MVLACVVLSAAYHWVNLTKPASINPGSVPLFPTSVPRGVASSFAPSEPPVVEPRHTARAIFEDQGYRSACDRNVRSQSSGVDLCSFPAFDQDL